MEAPNFLSCFCKMFLAAMSYLLESSPVILFVNGHHSNISISLIRKAKEGGVILQCLIPHLTYIMQPLNVGVYHPVKQAWSIVLKDYKIKTLAANVTKDVFPNSFGTHLKL